MEKTPECGVRMAELEGFSCIRCGRSVESHETALYSGMRICSECYYDLQACGRCARCSRELKSWEGRVAPDGNTYCEPCFLLLNEHSAKKGGSAWGEQFAFN